MGSGFELSDIGLAVYDRNNTYVEDRSGAEGAGIGAVAGTIVANLGYENVNYPHPLFHGDTLYVETEVLSKRESTSKPDRGIVTLKHIRRNQLGDVSSK